MRIGLSAFAVALVLLLGTVAAQFLESRMAAPVENAGKQMTAHTDAENTAQVFMNGRWYRKKNIETLLVMGVDDFGAITGGDSYNNTKQADFLALYVRDRDSGEGAAIHINRDTMTDITVLGVTGQAAGTRHAQLALAHTYGRGEDDSSKNTVKAVSNLLYGMNVDHYMTLTMDAVPLMNEWVGGVEVEVLEDFTGIDDSLKEGATVKLRGEQALTYVQTRKGLEDSTNLKRMERQRQYAAAWMNEAQDKLGEPEAVAELVLEIEDYHYSDCTVEELNSFAGSMSDNPEMQIYELEGEAVQGENYMEFYADDEAIQQLVLELFYEPVE